VSLRRAATVLLGVLALLAVAGPASAHVGGGAAGSDFDGRVLSVSPALPGVRVRVLQFGDELELVNRTATEVVVPGYSDEPYLRIGPDGVWRNALSPATYLNLNTNAAVRLPVDADPAAPPRWERVSTQPAYLWHDHRTHWMSTTLLPPAVAADPSHGHTVIRWTVPLRYGDTPVAVAGELTWSPPPPAALVWPLYLLAAAAAVAAGCLARTARPLGAVLLVGAAAALWHAAATPQPAATLGSHAGAVVAALLPALLAAAVALLGARSARRGRGAVTGLLAVVLGWLLLVVGLPDVDALWSAHLLASGPEVLARAAIALELSLGVGCVVGGAVAARRFRDAGRPAEVTAPAG
jgi:hypothetical protein